MSWRRPSETAERSSPRARRILGALSVTSWMAVNALAGLGVIAVLFIMLANGSWEGFFHEGEIWLCTFWMRRLHRGLNLSGSWFNWIFGSAVAVLGWARFGALRAALASPEEECG